MAAPPLTVFDVKPKLVRVKKRHEFQSSGRTFPELVSCEEGRKYIVKNNRKKRGRWTLVNELICSVLATFLALPISYPTIIHADPGVLDSASQSVGYYEELHFGSEYVEDAKSYDLLAFQDVLMNNSSIKNIFARILAFDIWVLNTDRNLDHIIFDAKGRMHMIDQDQSFGGDDWTQHDLFLNTRRVNLNNPIYQMVQRNYLDEGMYEIAKMKPEFIFAALNSVPKSWGFDRRKIMAVYNFLSSRQKYLIS